jgi:hypothetical protein
MNKDWTGNKNSTFTCLGASNHAQEEREVNDFYATDEIAIDKLFEVEEFDEHIWECAAGDGALSKRMIKLGKKVLSTDLIDRGYEDCISGVDFLKVETNETSPMFEGDIITNPPYRYITEFILKALELVQDGHKVAMFCKLTTLESQSRYDDIFSKYPPKTIYVFSKRVACYKNNDRSKYQSSAVCYAWFVWEKGFTGDPVIKWI